MALVTPEELMNKQVKRQIGLREVTVKIHRQRLMKRRYAAPLADCGLPRRSHQIEDLPVW